MNPGFLFRMALGAETFQPVHLASELAQTERVLQVHPEMPAALRERCDVVRRDHYDRHDALFPRDDPINRAASR